eukprot:4749295-Alexandrium_andersonii.AAC.2
MMWPVRQSADNDASAREPTSREEFSAGVAHSVHSEAADHMLLWRRAWSGSISAGSREARMAAITRRALAVGPSEGWPLRV